MCILLKVYIDMFIEAGGYGLILPVGNVIKVYNLYHFQEDTVSSKGNMIYKKAKSFTSGNREVTD